MQPLRNLTITLGIAAVISLMPITTVMARNQASIVAGELSAIANILSQRPKTAIDLTKVSGEYCFNVDMGKGGHMTHYAVDPPSTKEDIIDFVDARPLEKAGAKFTDLPPFPGQLNSMNPGQWYYLAPGSFEPHHGTKFRFPILIKATSLGKDNKP